MMGAEFVALSLGISENLYEMQESNFVMADAELRELLFAEKIAETSDGVL